MTSPTGAIDTAYVDIRPDTRRFTPELRRDVDRALRNVERSVTRALGRVTGVVSTALRGVASAFAAVVAGAVKLALVTTLVGGVSAALAGLTSAAAGLIPVIAGLVAALVAAAGVLVIIPGVVATLLTAVNVIKIGMIGVGEAIKAVVAGDVDKLNEALKNLAPSAQRFVREIKRLRPAFRALRLDVQQRLFADTDKTLRELTRATLPVLTRGFIAVAEALNGVVIKAVNALNTAANRNTLGGILTNTATAVSRLGVALRPLVQALLHVVAVGSALTSEFSGPLGRAIAEVSERISALAQSGELRQIFLDGLNALGEFIKLGGDLIGIIKGIFKAAGGAGEGGGIFGFFDRLNKLVNRSDVQRSLTAIFRSLADIGVALTPVLVALLQALVPVVKAIGTLAVAFAPSLVVLFTALGTALASLAPGFIALTPLIDVLASAFAPLARVLVELVKGLAPGLAVFTQALVVALESLVPAARPLGAAFGALLKALAPLLPVLGKLLATLLPVAVGALEQLAIVMEPVIRLLGAAFVGALEQLTPVLTQLVTNGLPFAVALAEAFSAALTPLVPVVVALARSFAESLLPHLPRLVEIGEQLIPIFVDLVRLFGESLLKILEDMGPLMPDLVTAFVNLVVALGELLVILAPVLPPLTDLVLQVARLVASESLPALIFLIQATADLFKVLGVAAHGVIDPFVRAKKATSEFGDTVKSGFGRATDVIRTFPSQITSALGNLGGLLFNAGKNLIQGLIDGISNKIGALKDILSNITSLIPKVKGPEDVDRRLLVPAGRAVMEGFGVGLSAGFGDVQRLLRSVTTDLPLNITAAGTTGSGRPVVVNVGGVTFTGIVTPQDARGAGEALGAGIADGLLRRDPPTRLRVI